MVDHSTRAAPSPYAAPPIQWGLVAVWWASGIGLVLTAVGAVAGVRMALGAADSEVADPGLGVAVVVVSLVLGVLVVLTGVLVRAQVVDGAERR